MTNGITNRIHALTHLISILIRESTENINNIEFMNMVGAIDYLDTRGQQELQQKITFLTTLSTLTEKSVLLESHCDKVHDWVCQ